MLLRLTRPVLEGVGGIKAALGRQRASPLGLVRVGGQRDGRPFLAQRPPTLLIDHRGLKIALMASDPFGDIVEDRIVLALR